MRLDRIHPRMLMELVEVLTKPHPIVYQQSWLTGEVPADWRLANVILIYKKGQKQNPGNYSSVSLISLPEAVMEQIIPSSIPQPGDQAPPSWVCERHVLANLISLLYRVTWSVCEGKVVDVYLDFSNIFATVYHNIILENLAGHYLDGCTIHRVKKRMAGPREWLGPELHPAGIQLQVVFPKALHWGHSWPV